MTVLMADIQKVKPVRTCDKSYANYRSFKPYLRDDFNKRCGYCDDIDYASGGSRGYHIDHFKPHSIEAFKALKQRYSNLVYSCPFCNGAKSNKWKDIDGFIDPCDNEYENHIGRNHKGQIEYKTEQGRYIYDNLELGLKRHELLWCIDKLKEQSKHVSNKIDELGEERPNKVELLHEFKKIQHKILEYSGMFYEDI